MELHVLKASAVECQLISLYHIDTCSTFNRHLHWYSVTVDQRLCWIGRQLTDFHRRHQLPINIYESVDIQWLLTIYQLTMECRSRYRLRVNLVSTKYWSSCWLTCQWSVDGGNQWTFDVLQMLLIYIPINEQIWVISPYSFLHVKQSS